MSDSGFRVPKSLMFKGIERRVHGGLWRCLAHLTLSILKACLKSFAASGFIWTLKLSTQRPKSIKAPNGPLFCVLLGSMSGSRRLVHACGTLMGGLRLFRVICVLFLWDFSRIRR